MSIEKSLADLAKNTDRIATALEAMASFQGIVPGDDIAPDEKPAKKEPAKKAPAKKAPAKKEPTEKKAAEKKAPEKKESVKSKLTIKDDVRPVLKRLRDEVSHDSVKALLKKYGANTIQQLDEKDYAAVIADAEEDLE